LGLGRLFYFSKKKMRKKKIIPCLKELGGCGSTCIEVGSALDYPKGVWEGQPEGMDWYEYRYTCPECGKEYLEETRDGAIPEIEDPMCNIRLINGKEIYEPREPYFLEYLGFNKNEKGVRLTAKELRKRFSDQGRKIK